MYKILKSALYDIIYPLKVSIYDTFFDFGIVAAVKISGGYRQQQDYDKRHRYGYDYDFCPQSHCYFLGQL
jgi:hypothetical protein